jgi:cellulose synthase (UDP-forming)
LHDEPVILHIGSDIALTGCTFDASASGVKITINYPTIHRALLKLRSAAVLEFPERGMRLPCAIQSVFIDEEQRALIGISYQLQSVVEERTAIAIAFGSSEQLIKNKNQHHYHRSILGSFVFLFRLAMLHGFKHLAFLVGAKFHSLFYSTKKN